jgi:hypothetical protein
MMAPFLSRSQSTQHTSSKFEEFAPKAQKVVDSVKWSGS